MKITAKRINENFLLEATNERGHKTLMDTTAVKDPQGPSPMELLLEAIAGCSAIDIISILNKKRQEITDYKVEVEGFRDSNEVPSIFTGIELKVYLEGNITKESALRASELSFTKYCSVSKILEKTADISYTVFLNGKKL